MNKDPKSFIRELEERCKPLEKNLCELYWKLATTGDEATAKELSKVEKTLKLLFSNREEFAQLKKWKLDGIADPLLSRQIDLLIKSYTPNQLDEATIADLVERQTEIENIFNIFRAEVDGKKLTNNDIKDLLKKEKNSETRKKIWEASKQIGKEAASKVRELVRKRNVAAQTLGFKNHFEMSLDLQELDSQWLFETFAYLKKATQKTFEKKIGGLHQKLADYYQTVPEKIRSWHYDDTFAQQAPAQVTVDLDPFVAEADILEICRDFYQGLDLDISDVLERSDLYEKKGKSQHAFCLRVDRAQDVRVLANIRPNAYWLSVMLHELGHAAYSKFIDTALPYFLRDEVHIFATEAIAMLMERVMHYPNWLHTILNVPGEDLAKLEEGLADSLILDKLIVVRWVMLVTHFERGLYENPDQDLNGLWWRLVKEFQLIEKPQGRDYPDWAAKIHIASHPVYYQNYLLGELMAAQIAETLEKEALHKPLWESSFYNVPAVGRLLKEKMFRFGTQWPWTKLVPYVTGQELSAKSFVAQFCR